MTHQGNGSLSAKSALVSGQGLVPRTLYFVNGGSNNNWSDKSNWALTSGGSGGAGTPNSQIAVFFDSNSPNCTLDQHGFCHSIAFGMDTDYSGTFDMNGKNLTVESYGQFRTGLLLMRSGTLILSNSKSDSPYGCSFGSGVVNAGTSTLYIKRSIIVAASNQPFYNLIFADPSEEVRIGFIVLYSHNATINGGTVTNGILKFNGSGNVGTVLHLEDGSVLSNTKIYIHASGSGSGDVTGDFSNCVDIPSFELTSGGDEFVLNQKTDLTGIGTFKVLNNGTFYTHGYSIKSASVEIAYSNAILDCSADLGSQTLMEISGNCTISSAGALNAGNSQWEIGGNLSVDQYSSVDQDDSQWYVEGNISILGNSWTAGSSGSFIAFSGSGSKTADMSFYSGNFKVTGTGTISTAGDLSCNDLTLLDGSLVISNSYTLDVNGSFVIEGGELVCGAGAITIYGNASFDRGAISLNNQAASIYIYSSVIMGSEFQITDHADPPETWTFSGSGLTLEFNGQTFGDMIFTGEVGASYEVYGIGMQCNDIRVSGTLSFASGFILQTENLKSSSTATLNSLNDQHWYLKCLDAGNYVKNMTVEWCDATLGYIIDASDGTCTDLGYNINWDFGPNKSCFGYLNAAAPAISGAGTSQKSLTGSWAAGWPDVGESPYNPRIYQVSMGESGLITINWTGYSGYAGLIYIDEYTEPTEIGKYFTALGDKSGVYHYSRTESGVSLEYVSGDQLDVGIENNGLIIYKGVANHTDGFTVNWQNAPNPASGPPYAPDTNKPLLALGSVTPNTGAATLNFTGTYSAAPEVIRTGSGNLISKSVSADTRQVTQTSYNGHSGGSVSSLSCAVYQANDKTSVFVLISGIAETEEAATVSSVTASGTSLNPFVKIGHKTLYNGSNYLRIEAWASIHSGYISGVTAYTGGTCKALCIANVVVYHHDLNNYYCFDGTAEPDYEVVAGYLAARKAIAFDMIIMDHYGGGSNLYTAYPPQQKLFEFSTNGCTEAVSIRTIDDRDGGEYTNHWSHTDEQYQVLLGIVINGLQNLVTHPSSGNLIQEETLAGSGLSISFITGSGSLACKPPEYSGAGNSKSYHTGAGDLSISEPVISGIGGLADAIGYGELVSKALISPGSYFIASKVGTGNLISPVPILDNQIILEGSGNLSAKAPIISGFATATDVFDCHYSVGISEDDLKIGEPSLTIKYGVAEFDIAQTGNIGMGDIITYGIGGRVVITGVLSYTRFNVSTLKGGFPANVTTPTPVVSIKRAFNSLKSAVGCDDVTGVPNPNGIVHENFIGTRNLHGWKSSVTLWCYNDGVDTQPVYINGSTASGYLTSYKYSITITSPGPANFSSPAPQDWRKLSNNIQHTKTGKAGEGYQLSVDDTDPGSYAIKINSVFVIISCLDIGGTCDNGIIIYCERDFASGGYGALNPRIRHSIIRNTGSYGILVDAEETLASPAYDNLSSWNNIVYGQSVACICLKNGSRSSYIYNNTIDHADDDCVGVIHYGSSTNRHCYMEFNVFAGFADRDVYFSNWNYAHFNYCFGKQSVFSPLLRRTNYIITESYTIVFVDRNNNNYNITSESPLFLAGINDVDTTFFSSEVFPYDLVGTRRGFPRISIGALECPVKFEFSGTNIRSVRQEKLDYIPYPDTPHQYGILRSEQNNGFYLRPMGFIQDDDSKAQFAREAKILIEMKNVVYDNSESHLYPTLVAEFQAYYDPDRLTIVMSKPPSFALGLLLKLIGDRQYIFSYDEQSSKLQIWLFPAREIIPSGLKSIINNMRGTT